MEVSMTLPIRILWSLVQYALCIGLAGGLVDLTVAMAHRAADAHRHGLVSLTELNRQLFGPIK